MSASGNTLAAACARMEDRIAELERERVMSNWQGMFTILEEQVEKDGARLKLRIAELEAEVQHQIERREEEKLRALRAGAALAEANAKYRSAAECSQDERDRAVAAEAALAERDRMLRLAILDGDHPGGMDADYLADLRARAESDATLLDT